MDTAVVRHRAGVAAVAAALGRTASGDAASATRRATSADAATASGTDTAGPEAVAGRATAAGVAEVAVGHGDRLCVESLGSLAALSGARVSRDRQQPQRADLACHRPGPQCLGRNRQ